MADTKISDLAAVTGLLGTDDFVLARAGDTKRIVASDLATFLGGGSELDYVERTTNLTITATTYSGADTFIAGNAVTYDGSTRVKIEAFAPATTASQFSQVTLWDGSTDLGVITGTGANTGDASYGVRYLTPSAGSHTYTLKALRGTGSATLFGGSGGTSGQYLPAFLRITVA